MDFPSSPPIGTTASNGTTSWRWNGYAWDVVETVCDPQMNAWSSVNSYVDLEITALPSPIGKDWSLLNYI